MLWFKKNKPTADQVVIAELTAEAEIIAREQRLAFELQRRHDELLVNPRPWDRRPRNKALKPRGAARPGTARQSRPAAA